MIKYIKHLLEALIVYIVYAVFWALPLRQASYIGGRAVRFIGPKLRVNKLARKNIAFALPDLSDSEREEILINMWDNLGRTVAEFPHIGRMGKEEFLNYVDIKGSDNLLEADKNKKNVICFGGHFGNWEVMPKSTAILGMPLTLAYRHANNPYVDSLINRNRDRYQKGSIRKGSLGAKALLKAIRNRDGIGMLLDQKMNNGIPVPFFGKDAMTAPAIAQIALRYEVQIVPVMTRRVNKCNFEVIIHEPLEIVKTEDEKNDIFSLMLRINQLFEEYIRKYPDQWFWVHNRWPK